jgi:hypothetical protein
MDAKMIWTFFWMYIFRRPGKFAGRSIERILSKGQETLCRLPQKLDWKMEENEFRNLYLYFKSNNYTSEQVGQAFRENRRLFQIKGTGGINLPPFPPPALPGFCSTMESLTPCKAF